MVTVADAPGVHWYHTVAFQLTHMFGSPTSAVAPSLLPLVVESVPTVTASAKASFAGGGTTSTVIGRRVSWCENPSGIDSLCSVFGPVTVIWKAFVAVSPP